MFGYIKFPLKIMYKDLFDICSNPNRRVAVWLSMLRMKIMYKDLFDICSNPNRRVAVWLNMLRMKIMYKIHL
jgi:hypothetical protein